VENQFYFHDRKKSIKVADEAATAATGEAAVVVLAAALITAVIAQTE
jgi:hypothetical protein